MGLCARRLDRIVRRVRARDRGRSPLAGQEGGEATPPRKQGSAREGEGRAHRPVAGSAGRGYPERRGRGSTRSRTPHRSRRLGRRRHRQRHPTVAVTRFASPSTARGRLRRPGDLLPRLETVEQPVRAFSELGRDARARGGPKRPSRSARARAAASGSSPRCSAHHACVVQLEAIAVVAGFFGETFELVVVGVLSGAHHRPDLHPALGRGRRPSRVGGPASRGRESALPRSSLTGR